MSEMMPVTIPAKITDKDWAESLRAVLDSSLYTPTKEACVKELLEMRKPRLMMVPAVTVASPTPQEEKA